MLESDWFLKVLNLWLNLAAAISKLFGQVKLDCSKANKSSSTNVTNQ